eukprot:TRINITY_DN982_c0_g1_i1.p1 TRINITY_DN982_c0_g1~~TRINITY_DN982_c0_g1_i1.p1  ORF type:complete len:271 (-),score=115.71 TRINITY_DN982_c0_g1_i1:45-800(-)
MSSIGTGYDLSSTTYSPDGRLFQVEYAVKAVDDSSTAIGLACKDGVVVGIEKLILSKMLVSGSNRRVFPVDRHAGLAAAGLVADGRQIITRARDECRNYSQNYGIQIPAKTLGDRIGSFMHVYTLYGSVRPFGCSVLLASYDQEGPQLFVVDPSGNSFGYHGIAIGKARQAAKTEIEKLKLSELTCRQAVIEIAKMIYKVHDFVKDKEFELELGWVCDESKKQFQLVPATIREEAERIAKAALEAEEGGED